jgi:hypothetical protein
LAFFSLNRFHKKEPPSELQEFKQTRAQKIFRFGYQSQALALRLRHGDVGTASLPERCFVVARGLGPKVALTQTKIDGYFEAAYRRLPLGISRFIRWLREPSSFAVRFCVAILLIVGGIFSFLPILGIWMLPLGLLLIAQDVPALQKPLVTALMWTEARWKSLKAKWQRSSRSN